MAVSTLGTFGQELLRVNQLEGELNKWLGVEFRTPEGQAALLNNPSAQRRLINAGVNRAAIIAGGQLAVFGYFRGGTFIPYTSRALALPEQMIVSAFLDGASEAAAGFQVTGKIDWRESFTEAVFGVNLAEVSMEFAIAGAGAAQREQARRNNVAFLEGSNKLKGAINGIPVAQLDTAASVLGEKLESEGIETIYIRADKLIALDQDGNFSKTLGLDPEEVSRLAAEGGLVEVSAATYVRHILAADGFDALIEHATDDPLAPTAAERIEYEESGIGDQIDDQLRQRTLARLAPGVDEGSLTKLNTDMTMIQDEVAAQLEATGNYDANKSRLYGLLTAQRYAARAIRIAEETGESVDASALFASDNLQIRGAEGVVTEGALEQAAGEAGLRLTANEVTWFEELMADIPNRDELLELAPSVLIEDGVLSVSPEDLQALDEFISGSVIADGALSVPPRLRKGDVLNRFALEQEANQAELAQAAIQRQNREITEEQYLEIISRLKPVTPYKQEDLPVPATKKEMRAALKKGQQERVGKAKPLIGKRVGLRLDIPAYENHDTWVPTIHAPNGKPLAHESVAHITGDISFTQAGDRAEVKAGRVGRGETSKAPFAQIQGTLESVSPTAVRNKMKEVFNDPDWVQVGYDPRRHTFFYDRTTQQPIVGATEVLQVGPLVMAKKPGYAQAEGFLFQEAASIQASPLDIEGTGPNGRILNWDLAEALTERHMEAHGRKLDATDEADRAIIMEALRAEYNEQVEQLDTGSGWYVADIAHAIEITKLILPQLDNPRERDFFLTIAALMSPQERPPQNWEKALIAMEEFFANDVLPEKKPNGKGFGVNAKSLPLTQHLIDTMGMDAALKFLQTPHTGRELAEMRRASGVFKDGDKTRKLAEYLPSEVNMTDEVLGIYMYGPKVGDFMMNSTGIDPDAVTVDLWLARTYNRMIGRSMCRLKRVRKSRSRPRCAPRQSVT